MESLITYDHLLSEINTLRQQLEEANETIEAIRTGQIDALVVRGKGGHELYTLKTADQIYRVFIEKMTEGAITLNANGIILYSNSQFATMVSLPLSKVVGFSFDTFIAHEYKEQFYSFFERGWMEDSKGEIVLVNQNTLTPVKLSLTSLQLDEGICLSVILTDLTTQKETQRQLKLNNEKLEEINHSLALSNYDLQQFAYAASHDLQEPLRKIQTFSTILKSKHFDELPEKSGRYLEKIITSSNRMKSMIIDILNYAGLSEEKAQCEFIDLKLMVMELLDDFEITIKEKKAKIIVGDLPHIEGIPSQIRRAFQNIISNALKFSKTSEPPFIRITAKNTSRDSFNDEKAEVRFCHISIMDNGIGFDENYVNGIFTLFQRLHTKDEYEGTGIGLAITKKILDKHNGRIMAYSKEGKGSEFIMVLPLFQKEK